MIFIILEIVRLSHTQRRSTGKRGLRCRQRLILGAFRYFEVGGNHSVLSRRSYDLNLKKWLDENEDLFRDCRAEPEKGRDAAEELAAAPGFDTLYAIMDRAETLYEFDLQKMIYPDYVKFKAWQEVCHFPKTDENLIRAGIAFVLFCCLCDKILDSRRIAPDLRAAVRGYLNSFREEDGMLESGMPGRNSAGTDKYGFPERQATEEKKMDPGSIRILQELWTEVCSGMAKIRDSEAAARIRREMKRAFVSEVYMSENPLPDRESFPRSKLHLVIDKSKAFENAAFMIAAGGQIAPVVKFPGAKLFSAVADLYWLADDLADFPEDMQNRSRNSLLYYCVPDEREISVEERVVMAFANIYLALKRLEESLRYVLEHTNPAFGNIMAETVYDWINGEAVRAT